MEDFELDTSGVVATTPDHNRLEIGRLQASYGNFPVTLARPVSVLRTPQGYNVEGFALNLGTGYLEGSWSSGEKTMTMTSTFERLPLGPLRLAGVPDVAGTATGSIRFNGQPGEPYGSLEVRFDGLALRDPQFQDLPPATLTTRAKLQKGRLNTGIILEGLKEPFEAQLDIPLELSASPLGWSLPPQGRLHGALSGKLDLALIPLLMSLDDQSVEGRLEINLGLRGTVGAPEITGEGRIESGAYENLRSGTLFKDVDILFATKTPRLSIEHASATDGEGGMITAQGWIDLIPNRDFPFSIEVVMEQATLVRLDNATAAAGGQLKLSGSLGKVLLAGQLQIRQAELRIPDRLPPEITELQVIEIHGVGQETGARPTQSPSRERDVQLDVKVVSLGRVFLRGRGLDSEWQGDLRISGKASEPVITGRFSVVRGHFNFLGKRFVLTQGLLTMDGTVPPSPQLDVIGEASAKDVTARLKLLGSALKPEVTLSSEPELPSDEILSRLLFGRSVSDITPVQAVNLAYAARRLTGGGNGFDLMGGTRRLLGVDQLEVKQSGERIEETTVSAGKYLSEGVYLEAEKGVGPESGKTSVEVEITPNVTLESEIGENAEGGVGLNWKLNY
jgi:translocation and assembly module TamB